MKYFLHKESFSIIKHPKGNVSFCPELVRARRALSVQTTSSEKWLFAVCINWWQTEHRFLLSLLSTSHGRPIHLIFITESSSIATIARCANMFAFFIESSTFPFPDMFQTPLARCYLRDSCSTLKPWIQTGSKFPNWGFDSSPPPISGDWIWF